MNNNLEVAKMFFKTYPEGWVEKSVRSVNSQEWSIKVIGYYRDDKGRANNTFLFEVVGSNGILSNEMATDLHQVVNDIIQTACVN